MKDLERLETLVNKVLRIIEGFEPTNARSFDTLSLELQGPLKISKVSEPNVSNVGLCASGSNFPKVLYDVTLFPRIKKNSFFRMLFIAILCFPSAMEA